jgi:pyruvate ferredoxin oxidoreductase delta subunit
MKKQMNWKEVQKGDILDAGTAQQFETGDWRSKKPIWHPETCIQCLQCWIHCPDTSIMVDRATSKMTGFDYKHCKGCGICAQVCPVKPVKSISMENEEK